MSPDTNNAGSTSLEERAIELLLRSHCLEVSTIIDLLDVGDREFRDMAKRNARIRELLEARRCGELQAPKAEPRQCGACEEWFLPYASQRFCSDACKKVGRLTPVSRRV